MKKARQFLLEDSPSIQNVASLCGFLIPDISANVSGNITESLQKTLYP